MTESAPFIVAYPYPSQGAHSPLLTPSDIDDFEHIPNQSPSSYHKIQVDISDPKSIPHERVRYRTVRAKNTRSC
jgi:hypothetical protein